MKHMDCEPRQRLATAGILFGLLATSTLGFLFESHDAILAGTSSERVEFVGYARESGPSSESNNHSWGQAEHRADGMYLDVSSRLNYQVTTAAAAKRVSYTVEPGDSLWVIAQTYDTDLSTLLSLNPAITSTIIQPGDILEVVPGFTGLIHTVHWGETLAQITQDYAVSTEEVMDTNQLASADTLQVGQQLLLPGAEARAERFMVASRRGEERRSTAAGGGGGIRWGWPITGGLHSSEYGRRWGGFHSGLDIAVPTGTPAASAAAGRVSFAGWDGGYGYSVIVDHGGGYETRYAHASKLLVVQGQQVSQGDDVILVGATGNSTGPHLHFEVLVNGTHQDPRLYLP